MNQNKPLPFQNLDRGAWRRLGYVAVAVMFTLNAVFSLIKLGVFNGVGGDFIQFLSAGSVADTYDFSRIYDVALIKSTQFAQLAPFGFLSTSFESHPSPYFAIFIVPFKYLSRYDLTTVFYGWSIINLMLFIAYIYRFTKRISRILSVEINYVSVIVPLLISYPVYINFLYGQPEVLLMVFTGEFIINLKSNKTFAAGLWLGLLFIKPQAIVLVIPALLVQQNWKIFLGFITSAAGIVLSSTILTGINGLNSLFKLLFSYAPGTEFFSPNGMANWRMLASNLNSWTNTWLWWIVAAIGMIVTLYLWWVLSRVKVSIGSPEWILIFGGIFSASLAFTWHSHIHMGMVLYPFLILFLFVNRQHGKIAFDSLVFSFPACLILSYMLGMILTFATKRSININSISGAALGITGLTLYILFTWYFYRKYSNPTNQFNMTQLVEETDVM